MLFTKDRSFYKSLAKLSFPLALSNLLTFLISLTDSIMIGKLGENATASVYLGALAATVLQMLITGAEGGITVGIAQYSGKNDNHSIKKISSVGTFSVLITGLLFAAASLFFSNWLSAVFLTEDTKLQGAEYLRILSVSFLPFSLSGALGSVLRSVESASIVAFASACAFVTNLVFDYLLIWGKLGFSEYGIRGAAYATVIARTFEALILVIYLLLIDKRVKMRIRDFLKFDKRLSLDFLQYTTPIVLGQIVWIINTLFSSYVFASFGSNATVAGFSIASTLNSLSYIVMNGLSAAVGIIIGKTVGENKIPQLKEYAYTTQIIFIALGLLTSLCLFISKSAFVSLYNVSDETRNIAISLIGILSITIIGTSYQSACLIGIVRGGADTSFIFKNDAFFIFVTVIPLTLLALYMNAPLTIVFLAMKSDQILKCIPAAIKINRFHWIKKITR